MTLAGLLLALAPAIQGESPPRGGDYLVGEATAIDAARRELTVKADAGGSVRVAVVTGASLLRAKPGATSLAEAAPLTFEEIAAGDRVMVRGALSNDRSALQARQVVVMSRDDVARKREEERADWRRRGILGVVTAVDTAKGEIAVRVGRWAGAQTLVIPTLGRSVAFRRYAPDSVKFSDARPSALAEVQAGDELRALGERDPGGTLFMAAQVVFGSFRVVSGTVTAADPGRNEIVVRDEQSRKSVTVTVSADARVRRLPAELAARLARGREGGPAPEGGERSRPMREPGSGPEDLLERLPSIALSDIKAGDRVLVSSTKGSDASRLTAIALVAGLEALQPSPGPGRAPRAPEAGLPPELMDLGLSVP